MVCSEGQAWLLHAQSKHGIEEQFTIAVKSIVDSIQKYKAHTKRKTRRNPSHEIPLSYESDDKYSSESSDEYAKNKHETHDMLYGLRYNHVII